MVLTFILANTLTYADIADAMTRSYEGYFTTVKMDADRMQAFVVNHDLDLAASYVAHDDETAIGIANLGRRGTLGWVGGIGVVPAWRRKGVGNLLMQRLIESAKNTGIRDLYLEVLTQNSAAYALYQQLGFQTLRKLHILNFDALPAEPKLVIQSTDVLLAIERPSPVRNPWQSAPETFRHRAATLQSIVAANVEIIYSSSGQSVQIMEIICTAENAISAVPLIAHLRLQNPDVPIYMVNLPEDHPAAPPLFQHGAKETMSQYEMLLRV